MRVLRIAAAVRPAESFGKGVCQAVLELAQQCRDGPARLGHKGDRWAAEQKAEADATLSRDGEQRVTHGGLRGLVGRADADMLLEHRDQGVRLTENQVFLGREISEPKAGRLLARIPVGREPHGLAVWPQPGRYSLGHTGIMR
ncbi:MULTISPECIES: hypothetical protein [unclassified Frankia]